MVLLHKQLLGWAGDTVAAAASKLLAKAVADGHVHGAHTGSDVEALEFASLYQQHHLHHHQQKHHHHTHLLPRPPTPRAPDSDHLGANGHDAAAAAESGSGPANGFGTVAAHSAPYHRLPGRSTPSGACTPTPEQNGGSITPRPWRPGGLLLPAPQMAAGATALAALAGGGIAAGRHLALSLLMLDTDRSAAILPAAALLVAGPGLCAGALARTLPLRRGTAAGAWVGGLLAGLTALVAAVTAGWAHESAHMAGLVRTYLYPYGVADTAEAMAGGALCAAAAYCLRAGAAIKPRSSRGGALLGAAAALLLAGLRLMLCSFTPYCLSLNLLLQGR